MCLLGVLFEWFGYLFFPPPLEHFICRAKQFARDDNSPSTSPPPPVNEGPPPPPNTSGNLAINRGHDVLNCFSIVSALPEPILY